MAAPASAAAASRTSGRHHKRLSGTRGHARRTFSLMVHGAEFGSGEELVINPDCFPDVKVNDLVEISQPDREHHRLILQVMKLNPVRGKLQAQSTCNHALISILKELAAQFNLDTFHSVIVQKVEPADVTVDFMELSFKDQFVSRADIWRVKVAMYGKCVYVGKHVATLGVRSQVEALLSNNQNVLCGVIGTDTKMIVRSRSSRLIWLVQMSTEMWEFAPDGELYYEKLINRLLRVLINKWSECSVSHSVTIIAFSRSFYDKNQFPEGYDPTSPPFRDPLHQGFGPGGGFVDAACGYGPAVHVDAETGRYYEDFYKVLVMNYSGPDWSHLLNILKKQFVQYHQTHRWRTTDEFIPAEYEICKRTRASGTAEPRVGGSCESPRSPGAVAMDPPSFELPSQSSNNSVYVKWKSLPFGVPSRAVDGNILEAINVTLNILDKHFMDRDLHRTGQSIVMLTAGSSVFKVDERFVEITKQRMMDNGVGMDMISLATPPLHVVPLFICRTKEALAAGTATTALQNFRTPTTTTPATTTTTPRPPHSPCLQLHSATTDDQSESGTTFYIVPHWVNITFLEFDCKCATQSTASKDTTRATLSGAFPSQQPSKKLFSHRMYTCECQRRRTNEFTPLPPFRMFDTTAPTEMLVFPIALTNLMKSRTLGGSLQSSQEAKDAKPTSTTRERTLSILSDTSLALPSSDQWQLCKSPDFVATRSPRLMQSYAASGVSPSFLARELLEEYDADVFSPAAWNPKDRDDQEWLLDEDDTNDATSSTLTGDALSHLTEKANSRWKSLSAHTGLSGATGGTSLMQSLLSPRAWIPHSQSSSSVNRVPPPNSFSPSRAVASKNRSIKSPPMAPLPRSAVQDVRPRASTNIDPSAIGDAPNGESLPHSVSIAASPPLARSLKLPDRSFRSPPLPRSVASALHPSPMELGGSYPKSPFLTGNGIFPGTRRLESDQTSTTPVVGSFAPSVSDLAHLVGGPQHSALSSRVNPFKYSNDTLESAAAAARLTSDRRRWSHLFPVLCHPTSSSSSSSSTCTETTQTHLGPNWKSLTTPAILPLTTDYFPAPKDLFTRYTESFYTLTLPSTDSDLFPKYKNHEELLIEMICQRLASDFQLVTKEAGTTDVDHTAHQSALFRSTAPSNNNKKENVEPLGTRSATNATYHLSMGHRIHQIMYDAERQAIDVKRYIERGAQGQQNEPAVYTYSLWVEQTQSFHPLQQRFYQYPMPEDNWNSLDHLLCGYHDEMSEMIKYRRIRFAVLPPAVATTTTSSETSSKETSQAQKEAYATRFTKFVDYLQTRVASEHGAQEKIVIKVSTKPLVSPDLTQKVATMSYKMSCESMASYVRLKSDDPRNEWLMMHVEDTMHVDKSYHFDVRWLACSGIIVDDFISTIRRKAKQAGLELRRIPEYTSVSFLQIHPLIAPIFLPMPLEIMQQGHGAAQEKSLIDVLVNQLGFVLDEERLADARGIGYGLGLGNEEEDSTSMGTAFTAQRRRMLSREEKEAALLEKWRTRGYKQYMHRQAPVFVRLIRNGIVWIPSYDYDQVSTPQQVHDLFDDICRLIQSSATLHALVAATCGDSSNGGEDK